MNTCAVHLCRHLGAALVLGMTARTLAQGTAFTYQGSLSDANGPVTGIFDFRAVVHDAVTGGGTVGTQVERLGQGVTNGLFTIQFDPGAGVFTGPARWLEISVRTNGASGYSTLEARQLLLPTPYAIHAATAGAATTAGSATTANMATTATSVAATGVTGTLAAGQLPANVAYRTGGNAFSGDQTVMGGKVGIGTTSPGAALQVSGNLISGGANTIDPATVEAAILGGTDNVIQVNAGRALIGGGSGNLIEAGSGSSIIGSGLNNSIRSASPYSVVGGGSGNEVSSGLRAFIGGGTGNVILTNRYAAVVGGVNNRIHSGADFSSIGGGASSTIGQGAYQAAVGGGAANVIEPGAYMSVIAGGRENTVRTNAALSAIGGGYLNRAGGWYSTVPGGFFNEAAGNYSFAAGRRAKAIHAGDFVWADSQVSDFTATGTDQFLIRAQGGVGIGTASPGADLHVVGSRLFNTMNVDSGSVGGTWFNLNNTSAGGRRWGLISTGTDNSEGPGALLVRDNSTLAVRMTFTPGGSVGIGTVSPAEPLEVSGRIASATGYRCRQGTGGAYGGNTFNFHWTGFQLASYVDNVFVGFVQGISDRRLKEDIRPMPLPALDRVMALNPVSFRYRNIPDSPFTGSPEEQEGFIADELQAVVPSAVTGARDATTETGQIQPQTVNIAPVVALLTKALQEQQAIIARQQEELDALKAAVNALLDQR